MRIAITLLLFIVKIKSECEIFGAIRCYTKYLEAEISGCKCCMPTGDSYLCMKCHQSYDGPNFESLIFQNDKKSCVPMSANQGKYALDIFGAKKNCNKNCENCIIDQNGEAKCTKCAGSFFLPYKSYCIRYPFSGSIFNLNNNPASENQGYKISEDLNIEECQNSCLYCSVLGVCNECVYKKVRMKEYQAYSGFSTITAASGLDCKTFDDRNPELLEIEYYLRPSLQSGKRQFPLPLNENSYRIFKIIEGCIGSWSSSCNDRSNPDSYMVDLSDILIDNLQHYLSYKTPYNNEGYSANLWKFRVFERVQTDFEFRAAKEEDCLNWNIDISNCYTSNEIPTLYWNSPNVFIFVNQRVLIRGIKFDGHGLYYSRFGDVKDCTSVHSPCCTVEPCPLPGAIEFDYLQYSQNYLDPPSGLFQFEFWPDVKWMKAPELIIENCEFNNFYANRLAPSLISMSARAGSVIIKDTKFDMNYFPVGMITNEAFEPRKIKFSLRDSDSLEYHGGYTCKDVYQTEFQGDCMSLVISGCTFTNYNPKSLRFDGSLYKSTAEGSIIYLRDFLGAITITQSSFKNIISTVASDEFRKCILPTTSYEVSDSFQKDKIYKYSQWVIDITASSRYKIKLEKHARILNENNVLGRSIGSVIYIRELQKGINLLSNIFAGNVLQTGAVFVEGFKKTDEFPIVIEGNIFKNNFVLYYALSVVLMKNSRDLIGLDCFGISISQNQFLSNIGCQHVFGNVVVSCENNAASAQTCKQEESITCWRDLYTTYVPLAGEEGEKINSPNINSEGYLHKRWEFGFDYLMEKLNSDSTVSVPEISKNVEKYKSIFTGNICDGNYALLSNCIYMQGALKAEISKNIISRNSIPLYNTLATQLESIAPFYYGKFPVKNNENDYFFIMDNHYSEINMMSESSPVLVRFAASVDISRNTFDNNKADFSGDYYLGGSVTVDNILGISRVILDSNSHINHVGISNQGLSVPLISFSFYYKGMNVWGFPYSSLHKRSGALYNNDPKLEIIGCSVENNHFEVMPYRVFPNKNYTGELGKTRVQEKFLYFYNGYPQLQRKTAILKYFDQNEAEFISTALPDPMSASSDSFIKTNGAVILLDKMIIRNNKNPAGMILFSPYFFEFTLRNSVFENNNNAEKTLVFSDLSSGGSNMGMISIIDETQSYWSQKRPIKLESNTFRKNLGKIIHVYAVTGSDNMGNVFFLKNTFEANQVNTTALVNLWNFKGVHLITNEFRGNLIKNGVVFATGSCENLYITDNSIVGNTATVAFCGYFNQIKGNITINRLSCQSNTASDYLFINTMEDLSLFGLSLFPTASIYIIESSFSIEKSTFAKNFDVVSAFLVLKSTLNLNELSFQDVKSQKNLYFPRLMWASIGSTVNILNSLVKNVNCTECTFGGLICAIKATLYLFQTNISIVNALTASIIYGNSSSVTIENVNIFKVIATGENSIGKIQMGSLEIIKSNFTDNSAEKYGLFSISLAPIKIRFSNFINNNGLKVTKNIFIKDSQEVLMSNCLFESNAAADINDKLDAPFVVSLESNIFLSNMTFKNGLGRVGALYISGFSTMYSTTISMSTFDSNTGIQLAGAIFSNVRTSVDSTIFQSNYMLSSDETCLIRIENTISFKIKSSQFMYYNGSAILTKFGNQVSIDQTEFRGPAAVNRWTNTRGVLFYSCNQITVTRSKFTNLQEFGLGGAGIFISVVLNMDFKIQLNIAETDFYGLNGVSGGAININVLNKTIIIANVAKSTFKSCSASSNGGGLYYESSNPESSLSLTSCSFVANKAMAGGGFFFKWQPITIPHGGRNYFFANSAIYGQNYAAYAIRLVQRATVEKNDYTFLTNPAQSVTNNSEIGRILGQDSESILVNSNLQRTKEILGAIIFEKGKLPQHEFSKGFEKSSARAIIDNLLYPDTFNMKPLETTYEKEKLLGDLVSGQIMSPPLIFDLVDEFGQIVLTQNNSYIAITLTNSSSKMKESSTFYSINGSFILYPFGVSFFPGEDLNLKIETDGVGIVPGRKFQNDFQPTGNFNLKSTFRLCEPNEYFADTDECLKCPENTLNVNNLIKGTDCQACPEGSVCKGEGYVGPAPNFWRLRNDLKRFIPCRNQESCAGAQPTGFTKGELSRMNCAQIFGGDPSFCLTGFCTEKYIGNLCSKCKEGYAVSNEKYCVPCKDNASYYVISVFVIIFAIAFIVLTVRNALIPPKNNAIFNKRAYNKRSLLIKIVINYFQIISIISTIDFKWNNEAKTSMEYQGKVISSTSEIFSIDCMIKGSESQEQKGTETFFLRLILIVMMPLIFFIVSVIVWILIFLIKHKRNIGKVHLPLIKSNMTTTMVIIMFMIHSTIVRYSFLSFRCENLGDELAPEYYMERDLDKKCWEGEHLVWAFLVGFPSLVIWGLGIPVFALFLLKSNRSKLNDQKFQKAYGFLYSGYRAKHYYWEIVVLARKIGMVLISVFLVTFGIQIQALAVLFLSFMSYLLQIKYEPFISDEINKLERVSLLSAFSIIYFSLYYLSESLNQTSGYVIFILMLLCTAIFLFLWIKLMIKEVFGRKARVNPL